MRRASPTTAALVALSALAALGVPCAAPSSARADASPPPADARDPDLARLRAAKDGAIRWNDVPPGQSDRYGHAMTLTDATPDRARDVMIDFRHMKELHKKFSTARVVGKSGGSTDVYMRVPVKLGPIEIEQWQVLRFEPAKRVGPGWIVEGKSISGNMKNGRVVMSVRPADAGVSIIKVDVLLTPKWPVPQSMIDEELRDAAFDLARGLAEKAQRHPGPVSIAR